MYIECLMYAQQYFTYSGELEMIKPCFHGAYIPVVEVNNMQINKYIA